MKLRGSLLCCRACPLFSTLCLAFIDEFPNKLMWQSFPLKFHSKKTTGFGPNLCTTAHLTLIINHKLGHFCSPPSKCCQVTFNMSAALYSPLRVNELAIASLSAKEAFWPLTRHCEFFLLAIASLNAFSWIFPICSMFWYIPAQKDKVWYLKRKIGNNQLFLGFSFNYLQNK